MKNILKVLGALLVLRVLFRLLRGGQGRFAGSRWRRYRAGHRAAFGSQPGAPVSIDDQWFGPGTSAPGGAFRTVPVE